MNDKDMMSYEYLKYDISVEVYPIYIHVAILVLRFSLFF